MIDDLVAGLAMDPAAPELGVERVELVRAQRAGLLAADERPDVLVQVPLVHQVRAGADVDHLEVAIQQLVHRGRGPRVPTLVDLVDHPCPSGLSLSDRLRPRRDDLRQPVPLSRDGVVAGVHTHAKSAIGHPVDASSHPLAPGPCRRHEVTVGPFRVRFGVTTRPR
jgi:hypothetical protein